MTLQVAARQSIGIATGAESGLDAIVSQPSPHRLALMLYGSVARGTADSGSDVDVLELVAGPALSYKSGNVSVTQYEASHLHALSRQGSLFVRHLRSEGIVLSDPFNSLRLALDAYVAPNSYDHIWKQIAVAAGILDPVATDFDMYVGGLARLGIYLLRTSVYVRSIERGQETFDLGNIKWIAEDKDLLCALGMRRREEFQRKDVEFIRKQLGRILPQISTNPYPTIEAFAVATSSRSDLAALFTVVLSDSDGVDYSALTLPLF